MHTSNGGDVVKLSGHFERKPNSPAEADSEEAFVALLLKVADNTCESGFHGLLVLVLDACNNFTHVHLTVVGLSQDFRKVNIVAKGGPCVSEGFMLAAGGAKDVRDQYERFISLFTDVVAGGTGDLKFSALGLVVNLEAGP